MEKTGCKIICGAPTTLAVKGFMMIMMMMNSPSWYDFCAILPPEVRAVGFFLFVKAALLLSLLPCVPLDRVFTTAVCGGRVPYRYRTVYHGPPFSTQHTPSFCVSPSSCQHFSRLENESRPCNGTAEAATFFTRRQLLSLDPGAKPCRLDPVILSRLKDLGIARNLPRKRSKRDGRRKQRRIPVLITSRDGCSFVPSGQRGADSPPPLPVFSATARWIALQRLPLQRTAVLFSRNAWK